MSVESLCIKKREKKKKQFLFWAFAPVIYSLVEKVLCFTAHIELFFCNRGCYRQSIFSDEMQCYILYMWLNTAAQ